MAMLIFEGVTQRWAIPLDRDGIEIGRNPQCGVRLAGDSLSRRHALITCLDGEYFLEDLGSRNKTFLNNREVTTRARLRHGDQIGLADHRCVFLDDAREEAEEAPFCFDRKATEEEYAACARPCDFPDGRFPIDVPEEHAQAIRRWITDCPSLFQERPALEAVACGACVADPRAAELLWLQLPFTWALPADEQEAASAFYSWVKSLPMPAVAADRDGKTYDRSETYMEAPPD